MGEDLLQQVGFSGNIPLFTPSIVFRHVAAMGEYLLQQRGFSGNIPLFTPSIVFRHVADQRS